MFTCKICNRSFKSVYALNGHTASHRIDKTINFPKCCCIFTRREIDIRFLGKYQQSLKTCTVCGKLFSGSRRLFCGGSCGAKNSNKTRAESGYTRSLESRSKTRISIQRTREILKSQYHRFESLHTASGKFCKVYYKTCDVCNRHFTTRNKKQNTCTLHIIKRANHENKNNGTTTVVLADGCEILECKKYYYLYSITNKVNGNYYVGIHQTSNINDNYLGSGKKLHYAIKKYGKGNFIKTILQFFDNIDDLLLAEKTIVNEEFIARTDTYNIAIGGGFGSKERNGLSFKGRTHTPDARAKMSNSLKGRKLSDETRKKISDSGRGKAKTEEHKRKLGEARKRVVAEKKLRKLQQND